MRYSERNLFRVSYGAPPALTLPRAFMFVPLAALLVLLAAACSTGGSATPQPTSTTVTTTTEAPHPTSTTPAETGDTPTQPGPVPGVACPVAVALCEFAVQMESVFATGNADAFFAAANPVGGTCTGVENLGGPSAGLCAGAAPNEVRYGYWAIQGGESLIVTEAELRDAMQRWFDSISRAGGASDAYGSGELKTGSISCTRRPERPSGDCIGNSIQVHFTFINPEAVNGTGLPGQRISFHVSASVVDGAVRANGFGTVVPPNRVLSSDLIDVTDSNGNPLLVEIYPWTH